MASQFTSDKREKRQAAAPKEDPLQQPRTTDTARLSFGSSDATIADLRVPDRHQVNLDLIGRYLAKDLSSQTKKPKHQLGMLERTNLYIQVVSDRFSQAGGSGLLGRLKANTLFAAHLCNPLNVHRCSQNGWLEQAYQERANHLAFEYAVAQPLKLVKLAKLTEALESFATALECAPHRTGAIHYTLGQFCLKIARLQADLAERSIDIYFEFEEQLEPFALRSPLYFSLINVRLPDSSDRTFCEPLKGAGADHRSHTLASAELKEVLLTSKIPFRDLALAAFEEASNHESQERFYPSGEEYRTAMIAWLSGDPDRATELLESVLTQGQIFPSDQELKGPNPDIAELLALIHEEKGDLREACLVLSRIFEDESSHPIEPRQCCQIIRLCEKLAVVQGERPEEGLKQAMHFLEKAVERNEQFCDSSRHRYRLSRELLNLARGYLHSCKL